MKISILQGSAAGTAVFAETQIPTTNANGLVTIEIGSGTPVTGTVAGIDWSAGSYFIKNETDPTGGTNYTITGTSQLLSVPYSLYAKTAGSTNGTSGHYVGELYGGGVVFWVDQTGQHGLICSMIDLSTAQAWSNVTTTLIGTTAQSDWDGLTNSNAIIGQGGHTGSPAKLCLDYTNADYGTGIFPDWYLPSIGELNDLWNNIKAVQKALDIDGNSSTTSLAKSYYWSSSEFNASSAWPFNFYNGYPLSSNKANTYYVRAIRAF
jgi:hypothetical protein